jgi:hypothetical protein
VEEAVEEAVEAAEAAEVAEVYQHQHQPRPNNPFL